MHRFFLSCALALSVALSLASGTAAQQVELLDFTSDSCPACVQMEPVLRELADAGAPIRRVDVNQERDLASRFRIQYLPTFVAVADGREVDRHVGSTSAEHLRQMLQRAHAAASQTAPTARGQSPAASPEARRSVPAQPVATSSAAAGDDDLVAASVRLRVEDPQGISYGTGTIISASRDEAIVLTCGHLFRESQGKLPVQVELFDRNAASPQVADTVEGEVLSYDLVRDLGLVRIRPRQPVRATPVAPREMTFQPGQKVASVGCDHGKQPTVWRTRLTAINRYVGPANVEAAGTPVQGRSGGGLFSERGELIGVCFAADEQGNEGLYVGLPAIYEELDRLGLGSQRVAAEPPVQQAGHELAQQPQPGASRLQLSGVDAPSHASPPPRTLADGGTMVSSESAGQLVPVSSGDVTSDEVSSENVAAQTQLANGVSLSAEEQAALEEIAERSRGGEVIVIIRPKAQGDRCEILSLDNPSPEFLNQLTALGSKATHPRFTTHKAQSTSPPMRTAAAPRTAAVPTNQQRPQTRRGVQGWSPVNRKAR